MPDFPKLKSSSRSTKAMDGPNFLTIFDSPEFTALSRFSHFSIGSQFAEMSSEICLKPSGEILQKQNSPRQIGKMNIKLNHGIDRERSAFTLIDVVVGMGILGIVCLSLFASFTFGFTLTKLYREELRATQILQEKTEAIRLYTWTQINDPNSVPRSFKESLTSNGPTFFRGTLTVNPVSLTNTTYSTNLRQVMVTVSWTNNNVKRSRTNSTFVSLYGLQDYVFPK